MKYIILILLTCLFMAAEAQTTDKTALHKEVKNTLLFSYGGPGIYFSAVYERHVMAKESYSAGLKAGIGTSFSAVLFPYELSLPFGAFFLYGGRNHHLDLSLNATAYILDQYNFQNNSNNKEVRFLYIPSLAYRFCKPSGGFTARLGVSPVINVNRITNTFAPWIDAGIGWSF